MTNDNKEQTYNCLIWQKEIKDLEEASKNNLFNFLVGGLPYAPDDVAYITHAKEVLVFSAPHGEGDGEEHGKLWELNVLYQDLLMSGQSPEQAFSTIVEQY